MSALGTLSPLAHSVCKAPRDTAKDVLASLLADPYGATVSAVHGRTVPDFGYVVAVQGHAEVLGSLSLAYLLTRYATRKRGQLAWQGRYVGVWFADHERGYVADVVEIFQDQERAIAAARARGEEAIWDIAAGREIGVNLQRAARPAATHSESDCSASLWVAGGVEHDRSGVTRCSTCKRSVYAPDVP